MWLRVPIKWVVLWSLWAGRLVRQPTVPVRVDGGSLRGIIAPDGTHAQYTAIPYATVTERFQGPKPVSKWEGVFDAYNEHIRCVQRFNSLIIGTEDCLTLNIYTPLPYNHKPLPVMVFIHGGGFRDGSGSPLIYGPDYLIKHGVILVTINYRVEILGFLCLGTKEAPGNAGLKDQVEALRWIKRNIKAFGGDPDNITIFGESAGSASVLYHILSPMSKGLFHKAIMESGSAISPWSFQFHPLKTASSLAKQIGLFTEKPDEILSLFKNLNVNDLMKARVARNEGDVVLSENIFVPCIEKFISNDEQFLTDTPYKILTSGKFNKVPMIMGYNDAEGFMFAGKENDTTIAKLNFNKALPRDLLFPTEEERKRTADVLERYYMKDKRISKETMAEFSRYEGDSGIVYPVVSTMDILIRLNNMPVYGYKFCYDGWMNFAKHTFGFGKYAGATHADELFYLFKIKISLPIAWIESEFIHIFTSLWTNFAKYGDPTPEVTSTIPIKWKPCDKKNPKVYEINKHCSISPLWEDDILRFWNITYTKYRRY